MRQEFGDLMVFVRGQRLQHIFEINVGIVPARLSMGSVASQTASMRIISATRAARQNTRSLKRQAR